MDDSALLLQLLEAEQSHQLRNKDSLWYAGNLRFLLHDAQKIIYDDFYASTDREIVMLCARRFGKSFLSIILCLEYAIRNPNTITRFVPPEITQGWQIALPTMMKLEQSYPVGLIRYHKTEKAWQVGKNSWLYLGGFDSQRDSQRGGEASLIVCDEAGFSDPDQYNYTMRSVLKPQLLHTRGRLVIPSTPSKYTDHPFMTETVFEARMAKKLHMYTIYDNPLLDAEQIEQAKVDCGGEHTEDWRREYLCETVRSTSMTVIPKWSNDYVRDFEPNPYSYRVLVGDFGGTNDKTVIHALSYEFITSATGIVQFIDERVYDPNTSTIEIVKGIKELHDKWIKPGKAPEQDHTAYLDCPGQLQVDLNNQHNMNVRIPFKDDFFAGVNLINIFINQKRIVVHPRCTFTAMTFENARFNERRTDYIRSPILGHCDAIASAIYGIRMLCKDRNGSPDQPINPQTQAWWNVKPKEDNRAAVAAAIFGGKK